MLDSFLIVNAQWPMGTSLVPMLMGRDNDNRIYIAGFDSDNHEQYLTRLSAEVGPVEGVADVDNGFGEGGFVPVKLGGGLQIEGALSIVDITATHLTISYEVINDIGLYQTALLRFLVNGQVDTTFGENGIALFPQLPESAQALDAQTETALDANGPALAKAQMLLVAYKLVFGQKFSYLIKVNEDGTLDPTFNHGRPIEWLPYAAVALHSTDHLVIDEQRRIVLRSVYEDRTTRARGILVSRFTAQGIDGSFGESGSFVLPGSGSFYGGLVIQSGSEGAVVASDRQSLWKVMP